MTIYDISEKAGVSIATVSRVLNGSPNVRPNTKKKVLEIMEAYGYTPNIFARGLGLNTMNSIGILCADSSDLYLAKAVYYIEQNLRSNGYNSILCCTGYDLSHKQNALSLLLSKRVDSIILVGSNFVEPNEEDNAYLRDAANQVPVMILNANYDYPNVYCTLCDDYTAVHQGTSKMIHSGISDILYLYNSHSYSGKRKLAGYQSAFLDSKLEIRSQYIQYYSGSHEDIQGVSEFISSLHDKGLTFHGVVASEDFLALGAIKFAKHHGFLIPQDLSIIGYNNSMLTDCCDPALSSIDNQLEKMCQHISKTTIDVLSGCPKPQVKMFDGEFVPRGTTCF